MNGLILGITVNLNMKYSASTTMYEKDIGIHAVDTSHGASKVTYHEKNKAKFLNNIFLPEIRTFGRKYFHSL